jgi:hypothetical protein
MNKRYSITLPGKTALYHSRPLNIWEAFNLYADLYTQGLSPRLVPL